MRSAVEFRKAVRLIGEAATAPERWPEALAQVAAATDVVGALVLPRREAPLAMWTPSVEALALEYARDDWRALDIRTRGIPKVEAGLAITDADVASREELDRHPFYRDLLRRHGLRWFAATGFRAGDDLWGLSLQRAATAEPFTPDELRAIGLLSSALCAAASLSKLIGSRALDAAMDALEQVEVAAFAVGPAGELLGRNALADARLGDGVEVVGGALRLRDPQGDAELSRRLRDLAVAPGRAPPASPVETRGRDGSRLAVRLVAVPEPARVAFAGAIALVTLRGVARRDAAEAARSLRRRFRLTRAEIDVVMRLAEGATLREAADGLGISYETARRQLKDAMGKLELRRQSELVGFVTRLSFDGAER